LCRFRDNIRTVFWLESNGERRLCEELLSGKLFSDSSVCDVDFYQIKLFLMLV
jgi:hypothetical protein